MADSFYRHHLPPLFPPLFYRQFLREEDIQDLPSGDELKSYYLENFIAIGYSQAEIDELMAKIDEHIAKRNKKLGIELTQ